MQGGQVAATGPQISYSPVCTYSLPHWYGGSFIFSFLYSVSDCLGSEQVAMCTFRTGYLAGGNTSSWTSAPPYWWVERLNWMIFFKQGGLAHMLSDHIQIKLVFVLSCCSAQSLPVVLWQAAIWTAYCMPRFLNSLCFFWISPPAIESTVATDSLSSVSRVCHIPSWSRTFWLSDSECCAISERYFY